MNSQKDYQSAYDKIYRRIKWTQRKINHVLSNIRRFRRNLKIYDKLNEELNLLFNKMNAIEEEAKQKGFTIKY